MPHVIWDDSLSEYKAVGDTALTQTQTWIWLLQQISNKQVMTEMLLANASLVKTEFHLKHL